MGSGEQRFFHHAVRFKVFLFMVLVSSGCEQNYGIVANLPKQVPAIPAVPAISGESPHLPEPSPSSTPIPTADEKFGKMRFNSLAGGFIHMCGIEKGSKKLYCWGYNGNGQLGDGTQVSKNLPVQIDGDTKYAKVAPGPYHTCGLTVDGAIKCWGANAYGEVEAETAPLWTVPHQVGTDFIDVASGFDSTCGIKKTGELKCWGYGGSLPINLDSNNKPDLFVAVEMSEFHLCAINRKGKLKCAGSNEFGQLGDGTKLSRNKLVEVDSANTYVDLSLANDHTCGITSEKKLRCFGANESGQLGDVTTTGRSSPVDVLGSDTYKSVATGFNFTCAVTSQNRMKCFGRNAINSIGDGSTGYIVPSEPYPGEVFGEIAAGRSNLCTNSHSKGLSCAGYNSHGQVGSGSFTPSEGRTFVQY
jgi:hypothetical protein